MTKDLHDFELIPNKVKVLIDKKEKRDIKNFTKNQKVDYYMEKLKLEKEKKQIIEMEIERIKSKLEPIYNGILK